MRELTGPLARLTDALGAPERSERMTDLLMEIGTLFDVTDGPGTVRYGFHESGIELVIEDGVLARVHAYTQAHYADDPDETFARIASAPIEGLPVAATAEEVIAHFGDPSEEGQDDVDDAEWVSYGLGSRSVRFVFDGEGRTLRIEVTAREVPEEPVVEEEPEAEPEEAAPVEPEVAPVESVAVEPEPEPVEPAASAVEPVAAPTLAESVGSSANSAREPSILTGRFAELEEILGEVITSSVAEAPLRALQGPPVVLTDDKREYLYRFEAEGIELRFVDEALAMVTVATQPMQNPQHPNGAARRAVGDVLRGVKGVPTLGATRAMLGDPSEASGHTNGTVVVFEKGHKTVTVYADAAGQVQFVAVGVTEVLRSLMADAAQVAQESAPSAASGSAAPHAVAAPEVAQPGPAVPQPAPVAAPPGPVPQPTPVAPSSESGSPSANSAPAIRAFVASPAGATPAQRTLAASGGASPTASGGASPTASGGVNAGVRVGANASQPAAPQRPRLRGPIEYFRAAIGADETSPEVVAIIRDAPCRPQFHVEGATAEYRFCPAGFNLYFSNRALSTIYLFTQRYTPSVAVVYQPFAGAPVEGLSPTATRQEIRAFMGEPDSARGDGPGGWVVYDYPEHSVMFSFDSSGRTAMVGIRARKK